MEKHRRSGYLGRDVIQLRPFKNADLPIVFEWIKHKPSLFFDHSPRTISGFVDDLMKRESRNFGVYRGEELVGLFICDHVNPTVCEGHVYFKRSFLGHKNTLRALREGVLLAAKLGYKKITSPVAEDNRLMIHLLKEIGAVQEGRFVAHATRDGKPVNVCYYSIFL